VPITCDGIDVVGTISTCLYKSGQFAFSHGSRRDCAVAQEADSQPNAGLAESDIAALKPQPSHVTPSMSWARFQPAYTGMVNSRFPIGSAKIAQQRKKLTRRL